MMKNRISTQVYRKHYDGEL